MAETLRLPLTYPLEFRSSSTDKGSKMVNCFAEKDGETMYAVKRPGLPYAGFQFGTGTGQGLFVFKGNLIGVVNNTVYKYDGTTITTVGTLTGTTSQCYFAKTINDGYLFIQKGDSGYTYDGTTLAQISSTGVSVTSMNAEGNGYITVPTVTFSAAPVGGTTATGTAILTGSSVTSVTISNTGTGYTHASITFSAPTLSGGTTATAILSVSGGSISAITITNPGSGYATPPTATISGDGTLATVGTIVISGSSIAGINVSNAGNGYLTAPTITIGTPWTASTAVTVNQQFFYNGNLYTVTTAGTTGTIPPTSTTYNSPFTDGTAQLVYAGVAASATANLNSFPVLYPIVPGACYFDTYVFIMTSDGTIWNSQPNNPTSWYALDFITAQDEPNAGVALAKHFNYLVAFGQWSTEFFYDAGLATGSPLLPNPTMRLEFGCANGNSVVEMEQTVVWVGVGQNTGRMVLMLDGTRPVQVSDASVERILNASLLQNVRAYSLKISGHYFYVLNLIDDNMTLVLDVKSKQWSIWTSYLNGSETILDGSYYASWNNKSYTLDNYDGKVYNINESAYLDDAGPIQFRIRTNLIDATSTKRKFISRLEVVGDKVGTTLNIRHTDDDYNTWSEYRTVNLKADRSILYQNGSFRRRAYEFFNTDNVPLRLQTCEMDIEPGSS